MAAPACECPRVRVAALIVRDGQVVCVRHRKGDDVYHLLPGGGVGWGETLEHALVREVAEETGLAVEVGRPLIVSDTIDPSGTRHVVNITFEASVTRGDLSDSPDDPRVEAVDLIDLTDLGAIDLRPPLGEMLARAVREGQAFEATYAGSLFTPDRSA